MDTDFVIAVAEPLESRVERIRCAAERRTAMYLPNIRLSPKWQRQINSFYAALLKQVSLAGEPINVVLESRSSRSAIRVGRYCVRHFETLALAEGLQRLGRSDQADVIGVTALLTRIETSLARLDQGQATRLRISNRRRTRATRLKLHPPDWQDALIAAAPRKLKVALLILYLTGCRPCEIERGVDFTIGRHDSDVRLTLDIAGAKCDEFRGQPLRTFQFLTEDMRCQVTELVSALRSCKPELCCSSASGTFRAAEISPRVWLLARKLWPLHEGRPTAYSFRYLFREEMARIGATRLEIARAMGHQSTRSSLSYGRQMSRQRTQELAIEIRVSIEPRHPSLYFEYADQRFERSDTRRLVARDVTHELYPDHRM